MFGATPQERAYIAPFLLFMALLGAGQLVAKLFEGQAFWMVATPQYWTFPLQTLACFAMLVCYWRFYEWRRPARLRFTIGIAAFVFILWVAPQEFLGFAPRQTGFDPDFFGKSGPLPTVHLGLRFLRLVVVVPLVEEIFWRGFLLRYLIHHDFTKVPIGTFRWPAFYSVAIVFALAHWGPNFWPPGPDFWPALITGALYNIVAHRSGQLSSCVLAHAITNLLLGIYIMRTGQWGFW